MCNANVIVSTELLFVLSNCCPLSVTFIMMLVRLHRARSGVYFGSTSCEDGILQQKTLSKRFLNVRVSCKYYEINESFLILNIILQEIV